MKSLRYVYTILSLVYILSSIHTVLCTQRRISNLVKNETPRRAKRVTRQENDLGKDDSKEFRSKISPRIKYLPFKLPKDYNALQIPSLGYVTAVSKALPSSEFDIFEVISYNVLVTMRIQDVSDVNEIEEDITFSTDLVLQWKDEVIAAAAMERFNFSSEEFGPEETDPFFKTLDQEFLNDIWTPDIFIERLVKVKHPEVMTKPVTVRLNEVTGEIIYISRLRIEMECEMDFHYYPADTQKCEVHIRSHSYSSDELTINWADGASGVTLEDCGGPNFDFKISDVDNDDHDERYIGNSTREFSGLQFNILARRKLSYHMVQTYLPSIFFIVITWLCFLVPPNMVEARIGITMTTLLTLTAMFASVRENSPTVSYVRAIDIWMVACIFFVFLTLLEFSVLLWMKSSPNESDNKLVNKTEANCCNCGTPPAAEAPATPTLKEDLNGESKLKKFVSESRISGFIEKSAFLIFSILFLVFNLVYWSWLLIGSKYYTWEVDPRFNECDADDG